MDAIGEIKMGPELEAFLQLMQDAINAHSGAVREVYSIRIGIDADGVKVKFNNYAWTRPYGRKVVQ